MSGTYHHSLTPAWKMRLRSLKWSWGFGGYTSPLQSRDVTLVASAIERQMLCLLYRSGARISDRGKSEVLGGIFMQRCKFVRSYCSLGMHVFTEGWSGGSDSDAFAGLSVVTPSRLVYWLSMVGLSFHKLHTRLGYMPARKGMIALAVWTWTILIAHAASHWWFFSIQGHA